MIDKLVKLCRDFSVDCRDGFVSNDEAYVEKWIQDNKLFEEIKCISQININKKEISKLWKKIKDITE